MRIQKKILFSLPLISTIFLTSACSLVNNSDNQQINQITDFYPIRSHAENNKPDVYNVLDLAKEAKCGQSRAALSPASLNIDDAEFDKLWTELRTKTGQSRYYQFTYGQCIDDGVLIKKVVDCAKGACGKKYTADTSKIWLNTWSGSDTPQTRNGQYVSANDIDNAQYFLQLPLKQNPEKNAWEFEIRYTEKPDVIAMKGYLDNSNFLRGKFILEYRAFYSSGNVYNEGVYDRQSRLQGKNIYFHDQPGKVSNIDYFQDGELEGQSIRYHLNGNIASKYLFKHGRQITKDGIEYADNGQIIEKYSYNEAGVKNGVWVKYYPDGTIKEKKQYVNGAITGKNETYWPNAKIKSREFYSNNKLINAESWLADGRQEEKYSYNAKGQKTGSHKGWYSNGQLRSHIRYNKNNQDVRELWHENGKRSSRDISKNNIKLSEEQWYENGKPQLKELYKNGQKISHQDWYKNGKPQFKKLYKNGSLSKFEIYDENGKLKSSYNY